MLNWEWYKDTNTKVVFIHLLLTVNYEDGKWKGREIKRGQRITSYKKLSDEINVSVQSVRTAIKHLILTGELTSLTTSENSLITVINYDKYQQLTSQSTSDQQAANKPLTSDQQAANNKGRNQEGKKLRKQEYEAHTPEAVHSDLSESNLDEDQVPEAPARKLTDAAMIKTAIEEFTSNDDLREALQGWIDMRKKNRKPPTIRAVNLALGQLNNLSRQTASQIQIVNQSTLSGWTSFYPLKNDGGEKNNGTEQPVKSKLANRSGITTV